MSVIDTSNGIYEYTEVKFTLGTRRLNREISKVNLLDLKKILDQFNINFGLIFGTLLGAIRENNFIAHDEDTDIFVLKENEKDILDLLFLLRDSGFEVGRYDNNLMSIIRNGEYIDIYFFEKKGTNARKCQGYVINDSFLSNVIEYEFLGEMFKIPQNPEELLVKMYGSDWMVPKENTSAANYGFYLTIRNYISKNSPILYRYIGWIKRKVNL